MAKGCVIALAPLIVYAHAAVDSLHVVKSARNQGYLLSGLGKLRIPMLG